MKIFKDIKNSIYSKSFYEEVKNGQNMPAWMYFIKISLIQTVLLTIIFLLLAVPAINNIFSTNSKNKIVSYFPEELTVKLKAGQISTNVEEPYKIPYTESFKSEMDKDRRDTPKAENFIVIDTVSPFSMDLYYEYSTEILITKDSLIARKSNGQITIQPLKSFPDGELNRAKIFEWIGLAQPFFKFVIPVTAIFYFTVTLFGLFVANLIFLLIASLVVLLILKLQKKSIPYSTIYRQGLYAITALMIIEVLYSILGLNPGFFVSLVLFEISYFINTHTAEVKVVNQDQPSQ